MAELRSPIHEHLSQALETSFLNAHVVSPEQYRTGLILNDHKRQLKVLSTLIRELRTCSAFSFSVAFITSGGLSSLMGALLDAQARGVKGRIITSAYQRFTEPAALRKIQEVLPSIELKIVWGPFHAKGYIFDHDSYRTLLIGSSNLTAQALSTNGEWNVLLSALPGGEFYQRTAQEYDIVWQGAFSVTEALLDHYEKLYNTVSPEKRTVPALPAWDEMEGKDTPSLPGVVANTMQKAALASLSALRFREEDKALVVAATGTGKTYMAAMDVKTVHPRRFLYVVHSKEILKASYESFQRIVRLPVRYGIVGDGYKDFHADYIFASKDTLYRDDILNHFSPDDFDYIVIDEAHHVAAPSYQKILSYFKPAFLLGMTATPERTDNQDIAVYFGGNIAYDIRLNHALEAGLLCPFHYFGISDLTIDGTAIDDKAIFSRLIAPERVDKIFSVLRTYAMNWGQRSRGLIFVSRVDEAYEIARLLGKKGLRVEAVSGADNSDTRARAIERLQGDAGDYLEYIVTVDVFNEGVDIPALNQIILLRPTQSAIIFTQQIGRGMRLSPGKEFVTIVDFIGNYTNNYLIPIALFGDTTYNKDRLRKLLSDEPSYLPGESVISFDRISKERIFDSIATTNFSKLTFLRDAYRQMKDTVGRVPSLMDFVSLGGIDPMLFAGTSGSDIQKKSYYGFVITHVEPELSPTVTSRHLASLTFLTAYVGQAKRPYEGIMMAHALHRGCFTDTEIRYALEQEWGGAWELGAYRSALSVFGQGFLKEESYSKYGGFDYFIYEGEAWHVSPEFASLLENSVYRKQVEDLISYSRCMWQEDDTEPGPHCFKLYGRYTRRDVARFLGWKEADVSTMYGYTIKNNQCPIFVTYHKDAENTAASQMYEDRFLSPSHFQWMTRSNVRLTSKEPRLIMDQKNSGLEILLFVKKKDDEGQAFHYLGPVKYQEESAQELTMYNEQKKPLPVVRIYYDLVYSVEPKLYDYLVEDGTHTVIASQSVS